MRIELTVSRIATTNKPDESLKPTIYNHFKRENISIEELFLFYNSSSSFTVSPAIYKKNHILDKNWESQEVVYIDFDGGMTYNEALQCCKNFNINPIIKYSTYSSTSTIEKFRLIFVLDEVIRDKILMKNIIQAFNFIFNFQCDQSALNLSNYYFGGYDAIFLSSKKTNVNHLKEVINIINYSKYKGDSRRLISVNNNSNDNDKNNEEQSNQTFRIRKDDWDLLYYNCDTYRRFVDGKWLYHFELVGIAMNMQRIDGGAKKYKEIFDLHSKSHSSYSDQRRNMVDYFKKKNYNSQNLSEFSNSENDSQYTSFIDVILQNRDSNQNKIEIIKNANSEEYIDIEKAEEIFKEKINKAQEDEGNGIYIFKVPTGFGKTQYLKDLPNSYIAFYHHRIIDDITIGKDTNTYNRVYPVPKFNDSQINESVKMLFNQGRFEKAKEIIKKNKEKCEDKQAFLNYQKNDTTTFLADKPSYTTISREVNKHNKYFSTVFFDEDPIQEIAKIETITINMLRSFLEKIKKQKSDLYKAIEGIINSKTNQVIETKKINFDLDEIEDYMEGLNINIYSLLNSYAYYIDKNKTTGNDIIYYIQHKKLEDDCKYIIMSATPNIDYYTHIYKDRVKVIDLSNIKQKGVIFQYTNLSYSQTSLTQKVINQLNENIGNMPVITYRSIKDHFTKPSTCHFGYLYGSNDLENEEMAVVGINRYENPRYILLAYLMGIESKEGYEMQYQQVEYNGYRFKFMTFKDNNLRKVHLDITNNEMIQAVGRGRILRNDNIVHLYSGFPLKGVVFEDIKFC